MTKFPVPERIWVDERGETWTVEPLSFEVPTVPFVPERLVRALKWTKTEDRHRGSFKRETWEAVIPFGSYFIHAQEDGHFPKPYMLRATIAGVRDFYDTLEEAQGVAQTDFGFRTEACF